MHLEDPLPIIKPPHPDPSLDPFENGLGVLTRAGVVTGHVATWRSRFWTPTHPLRHQHWVFLVVVWADGTREQEEDYAPWARVREMTDGYFAWPGGTPRGGRYDFAWLAPDEAAAERSRLGIDDVPS